MVHTYKNNGYNIVLDANSGSIHVVDEVAYDVIDNYTSSDMRQMIKGKYPGIDDHDIDEICSDVEELKKEGKLFSEDIFEPFAKDFNSRNSVLKALCLHVAHVCNMDCEYCFAGKGSYNGKSGLMSYDTGVKAIDFLIENSKDRKNLEVDFFGGEPLLNWEVVKELVRYGRSREQECGKNFRFTLTTNGLLIDDDVIDFTCREMSNVVISLDGRKEVNDRMRHLPGGGSSYDAIIGGFKKLAEARNQKNYYMRGTYTANNKDFVEDILHMADLGFKQLSAEPVVAPSDASYALKEGDVPYLCEQYEKLAIEMINRKKQGSGFTFYHYMIDLMLIRASHCIEQCGFSTILITSKCKNHKFSLSSLTSILFASATLIVSS